MVRLPGVLLALAVLAGACRSPHTGFSTANARAHLDTLGGSIGSRWIGTDANRRAREYIIGELTRQGFTVRLQSVVARIPELGRSARVVNIVATRAGTTAEAIALVSHYDSVPDGPGGADDGFGVAVSLETARVLSGESLRHSFMVLVTDGEEAGLMGAAAAAEDPDIGGRIAAYLNLEAVGSSGPALLFEAGPGNEWLTEIWARHAPRPRGSSLGLEVYRRLPNDTDFSMFARRGVPGLNVALVGDGYAYHTSRDTAARVPDTSLQRAGDNAVAMVRALDRDDPSRRTTAEPVYFDVLGLTAVSVTPRTAWLAGLAALLLGLVAWWRLTREAARVAGGWRYALTIVWTIVGVTAVGCGLLGAVWILRSARETYHPWYARPDALLGLLLAAGVTAGWGVFRLATLLPNGARGVRHPAAVWSMALPVWIGLAAAALWLAHAAAYLWIVPLLVLGLAALVAPPARSRPLALMSLTVLAATAVVWIRDWYLLYHFAVTVFGRVPVVTPLFVYPAFVAAGAVMVVPPLVAALAAVHFVDRPPVVTASCLLALAVTGGLAYAAPAYTPERPLRRQVRFIQDGPAGLAFWEVGGAEPGIDLGPGSGLDWLPTKEAPTTSPPLPRLPQPYVFRAQTTASSVVPADVTAVVDERAQDVQLTMTVRPRETGLSAVFVLPPGVEPLGANLPGRIGPDQRWSAVFVSPPEDGLELRAFFEPGRASALRDALVVLTSIRLPGQADGYGLPAWLTTERTAWRSRALYIVRPAWPAGPAGP